MSEPLEIHQLFHGYKRGHEQLAASIKLNRADSDLVTRLSDLSGTLVSGFAFESYLTTYPLPSAQSYAVALTRPDPNAPRPGCVLTHTLLVGIEDWATLPNPVEISSLFADSTIAPDDPIPPLKYVPMPYVSRNKPLISPEDEDFVARYFGEGIRPIVWVDEVDPKGKLWCIVTGLWPALRRSFSACTLCLQPRSLQSRMFDLMFAPRVASSRFSRLSGDHFVVASPTMGERWQHEFAEQMFGGAIIDSDSWALISVLDDNPLSVRKLFLFRDLWRRSSEKSTAAIGAFDLLESMNAPEATARLQSIALDRALSAVDSLSSSERTELFSMLMVRIPRVHGADLEQRKAFEGFLDLLVRDVLAESPDTVVSEIERAWPRLKDALDLRAGFITALAGALPLSPALTSAIARHPDIGKELAAQQPVAFANALNEPEAKFLREQTMEWLDEVSFRSRLPGFRIPLLGQLRPQAAALVRKMLIDVGEEEAEGLLNVLFVKNGLPYQNHEILEAVIDLIARPFPVLTQAWIELSDRRDETVAAVMSATFAASRREYCKILGTSEIDSKFTRLVLANWIVRNSAHNQRLVSQLAEEAANDHRILDLLIEPDLGEVGSKAFQVLVESISRIVALPDSLVEKAYRYRPDNPKLIDIVIRSGVADYVQSGRSQIVLDKVLAGDPFTKWLLGKSWKLGGLIKTFISESESCSRGWEVIAKLPDLSYRQDVVVGVIDSILGLTSAYCSEAVIQTWVKVIRRAHHSDRTFGVELCGQAIRFAFENPRLPVSELVVEAFFPLYHSVTELKRTPSTASSLFSFWNWDQGSELREALVEKALLGSWPPGNVALAAHDFGLLRKILKRMGRRTRWQLFARRMYTDLASKNDAQSRALANGLSSLLKNQDYDEDWD